MADTLTGSILTLGVRAKAGAPQTAGRVLVQGVTRILEAARGPWPVLTGASRDSLGFVFNGREIRIVAIGYAPFIVSRGIRPWDAYLWVPIQQFVQYDGPKALGGALIEALAEGA